MKTKVKTVAILPNSNGVTFSSDVPDKESMDFFLRNWWKISNVVYRYNIWKIFIEQAKCGKLKLRRLVDALKVFLVKENHYILKYDVLKQIYELGAKYSKEIAANNVFASLEDSLMQTLISHRTMENTYEMIFGFIVPLIGESGCDSLIQILKDTKDTCKFRPKPSQLNHVLHQLILHGKCSKSEFADYFKMIHGRETYE